MWCCIPYAIKNVNKPSIFGVSVMSVNESPIDINSRICLISGWIVDKQEKAILAFHRAKRLLSPKVLEKLEKYELKI